MATAAGRFPGRTASLSTQVTGALVAGLAAGYGIAVPVGAIAPLLISLTARTSFRVGAAAALGVATADGLFCLLVVAGGRAVKQWVEPVARPMTLLGAVVLLGWAAHTAFTAVRAHRSPSDGRGTTPVRPRLSSPGRAYAALLGLTLLNPATVVYFGALVLGDQPSNGPVFVGAAFAASASWQLLLAGSGRLVGRLLTGRRGRLGTALASSVLVTVLAARLLW